MSWVGHVTRMGEEGNAYNVLVRKPEKGTIRRPTRIWKGNITMDVMEVVWEGVD
jgi:hypothetical protein